MQYKSATGIDYVSAATPLPVTLSGTIPATITDDTTTNATMYPTWVTAATGNLPIKVSSTKLTFNPSLGLMVMNGNATTAPAAISGTQFQISGTDGSQAAALLDAFGNSATTTYRRADGTNASKSALVAEDVIMNLRAFGYSTSAYTATGKANVQIVAAENWSDTAQGTIVRFLVTAPTTTTTAAYFDFGTNGLIIYSGVAAASAPANALAIGSATQTTIGANGAASALTANPLGYIKAYLGTTAIIIPYYNA